MIVSLATLAPTPFVLSLSKDCLSWERGNKAERPFDKLRANGLGGGL